MITKAALLLFRDNEGSTELLFARAKGRGYFVFPGGKREEGETLEGALRRELQEELGTDVKNVEKMGVVAGRTPDGRDMEMHLYSGDLVGTPHPQAEIEEIVWMSKIGISKHSRAMTPMTLDHVLPFLESANAW